MSNEKPREAAIEGWFETDTDTPHLIGTKCTSCGTYFFPRETVFCRSPHCRGTEFTDVPLSRTGKLWSFTNNCYPPPKPYMASDPFVPYIVAAVELEAEKMVVLGQIVSGVEIADLSAGMDMELVIDTLFEDEEKTHLVWKWKPAA